MYPVWVGSEPVSLSVYPVWGGSEPVSLSMYPVWVGSEPANRRGCSWPRGAACPPPAMMDAGRLRRPAPPRWMASLFGGPEMDRSDRHRVRARRWRSVGGLLLRAAGDDAR